MIDLCVSMFVWLVGSVWLSEVVWFVDWLVWFFSWLVEPLFRLGGWFVWLIRLVGRLSDWLLIEQLGGWFL